MRGERMPAGGPGEAPSRPALLLPGRAAQPRVPKQTLLARLRRANAPVSSKRGLGRPRTETSVLAQQFHQAENCYAAIIYRDVLAARCRSKLESAAPRPIL